MPSKAPSSLPSQAGRTTPVLIWSVVDLYPMTATLIYRNSPARYTIHWGDTVRTVSTGQQPEMHRYPRPGNYMACVVLDGDHEPAAWAQILIRDTPRPQVSLVPESDDRPDIVHLQIDEPEDGPISRYEINWGDGTPIETVIGIPGTRPTWRGYPPGKYTVQVRDMSTMVYRKFELEVGAPEYDPDFTLAADPGNAYQANLEVTTVTDDKTVRIDWGDGDQADIASEVGATAAHTYAGAGTYFVQLYYTDGSGARTQLFDAGGAER